MLTRNVLELLAEVCKEPQILENQNFDLLENDILDSFAFLTFLAEVEDRWNIVIHPTLVSAEQWRTPAQIVQIVSSFSPR